MIPRLTAPGDTVTMKVGRCVPIDHERGPMVEFGNADNAEHIINVPRIAADWWLVNNGYKYEDNTVAYDQVLGDAITFKRTAPAKAGLAAGWAFKKETAKQTVAPPAPASTPAPAPPPTPAASPRVPRAERPVVDPAARQDAARAAVLGELEYVIEKAVPMLRKKKIPFTCDLNALVAQIIIRTERGR